MDKAKKIAVELILLIVFVLPTVSAQLTPIARWDVVPYQRINAGETFNVGVVAFSKEGIDRVEFDISGQGYSGGTKTATEMTYNPRTDVWEYWVPVNASEFTSDGVIEINATVIGNDGGVRRSSDLENVGLDPLILNVNPQNTLPSPEVWVAPSGGSDSWGIEAVGDPSKQFVTIGKAIDIIRQWRNANGYGNNVEGGIVRLNPGTHTSDSGGINYEIAADDEWITITTAVGGNRENTILQSGYVAPARKIRAMGITLQNTGAGTVLLMNSANRAVTKVWLDDCNLFGYDRWSSGSVVVPGSFETMYYTGCSVNNTVRGVSDGGTNIQLVRNHNVTYIGDDAFQNVPLIINAEVLDIYPWCPEGHPGRTDPSLIDGTCLHADAWQHWGGNDVNGWDDNVIVYNYRATNLNYASLFIRADISSAPTHAQGMAFVNVHMSGPNSNAGWYRWVDHLIIWHSTFDLSASGGNITGRMSFYNDNYPTGTFGPDIKNASVVGSLFSGITTNDESRIDWSGFDQNHFTNDYWTMVRGTNPTTGDPLLDSYGIPQNTSLHDRVSPLLVPIDADNNLRDSMGDVGAYEFQGGTGECTDNQDCDDANDCTGDKCDSGSCRYINYNLDGNSNIGLGDIIQIIAYWGGSNPNVDLDGNGNVGLSDIIILIGVWGAYC